MKPAPGRRSATPRSRRSHFLAALRRAGDRRIGRDRAYPARCSLDRSKIERSVVRAHHRLDVEVDATNRDRPHADYIRTPRTFERTFVSLSTEVTRQRVVPSASPLLSASFLPLGEGRHLLWCVAPQSFSHQTVSRSTPLLRLSRLAVRSLSPYSERARTSPPTPTRQQTTTCRDGGAHRSHSSLATGFQGCLFQVHSLTQPTGFPADTQSEPAPRLRQRTLATLPVRSGQWDGGSPKKGLLSGFCITTPRGGARHFPAI